MARLNTKDNNKKILFTLITTTVILIALIVWQQRKNSFSNVDNKTPDEQQEIVVNDESKIENTAQVVSANPVASDLAKKVLDDGGNAVDAAVALSFALSVTDPQNSGIGGGGGMLIYDTKTQESYFYDYFTSSGDVDPVSNIGIPGFLKGMETISNDLGSIPFNELMDYPIGLAEEGVRVSAGYANMLQMYTYIGQVNSALVNENDQLLQEGDILRQDDLIATFKEVQEKGSDILYGGEHEISRDFLEVTGISPESLASYKVLKSTPLEGTYKDKTILAAPAPFSGLTLLQNLIIDEEFDYLGQHDLKDPDYIQKYKKLSDFTRQETRKNIGDPQFNSIDYDALLDREDLKERFENFTESNSKFEDKESETTTAFSVIDKDGLIVSATNTLSNYWGSYIIQHGIIYNNTMKNFYSGPNKFEYNKRPKTAISPLIIFDSKGNIETLETSGGVRIPYMETEYLVNTIKFGMSPQEANDLERKYFDKGYLIFETDAPISTATSIEDIEYEGDSITRKSSDLWGIMNGIRINEDGIDIHVDKRSYFDQESVHIKYK